MSDTAFTNHSTASTAFKANQGETNISFGTIKFPTANHEEETGGMGITFTEYKYSRPDKDGNYNPVSTGTNISLPLPRALAAGYSAEWQNANLGAFGQVLSQNIPGAVDALSKVGSALSKSVSSGSSKDFSDGIRSMVEEIKFSSIVGGVANAASALGTDILTNNALFRNATTSIGVARNPFLAAQFEGVQFRTFPFEYDLIPRSKKDSEAIDKLIRALKYGMHPSYIEFGSLQNALFRYPHIYKPKFTKGKYLFDFGMCVIKDLNVDYHAEGSPIYADDNGEKIPMHVRLTFVMQEIEIVTKEKLSAFKDFDGESQGR